MMTIVKRCKVQVYLQQYMHKGIEQWHFKNVFLQKKTIQCRRPYNVKKQHYKELHIIKLPLSKLCGNSVYHAYCKNKVKSSVNSNTIRHDCSNIYNQAYHTGNCIQLIINIKLLPDTSVIIIITTIASITVSYLHIKLFIFFKKLRLGIFINVSC